VYKPRWHLALQRNFAVTKLQCRDLDAEFMQFT
jgi:hypothetical protein